jgi:hypothetical protein
MDWHFFILRTEGAFQDGCAVISRLRSNPLSPHFKPPNLHYIEKLHKNPHPYLSIMPA